MFYQLYNSLFFCPLPVSPSIHYSVYLSFSLSIISTPILCGRKCYLLWSHLRFLNLFFLFKVFVIIFYTRSFHKCGVTMLSGPPGPTILVSAAHCNYICKVKLNFGAFSQSTYWPLKPTLLIFRMN